MKSKFLTYALIFMALLVVFQYVYSMQIIDKYEADIQIFKFKIQTLESENVALKAQIL